MFQRRIGSLLTLLIASGVVAPLVVHAKVKKALQEEYLSRSMNFESQGPAHLDAKSLFNISEPFQISSLFIVVSGPSDVSLEVFYRGNRLLREPLKQTLTSLTVPVFASVSNEGDLTFDFSGPFTLASIAISYSRLPVTPPPAPPLPPTPPSCVLMGFGAFGSELYNYRLSIGGSVIAGSNDLGSFIQMASGHRSQGSCSAPEPLPICGLKGAGNYRGLPWNYLIDLNDQDFDATLAFESTVSIIRLLANNGFCRTDNSSTCQLLPAGEYGGRRWAYRAAIEQTVVGGFENLDSAMQRVSELRNLGVCH